MKTYTPFTTKEIRPEGWMRRQLEIQAAGLAGNLDKVWPDVRDSAWIGGTREGWERVPYWLDGFIPLAFLLEDADMQARAKKYVDAILSRQKPDGWICPCPDEERAGYDVWALFLLGKTLCVWYDSTGDERVPDALYRAYKNLYGMMKTGELSLVRWGKYRWFEAYLSLSRVYRRYGEEWIRALADLIRQQGQDYRELTELWERPLNQWTLDTHIVNLMEMLKYEALEKQMFPEEPYRGEGERLYDILRRYNGTVTGTLTGDECLSGISPVQGTELCAIVEQMYSFETLFANSGDTEWLERLEKLAFNCLPGTISDDMWTHQYVQMANQIECTRFPGKSFFRTNGPSAHIFGLEPHFGCCTANHGQGWPKFALSAFYRESDGICCALAIPATLRTEWKGTPVTIRIETDYPFLNTVRYTVEAPSPVRMKLRVRIPSFAEKITLDGKPIRSRRWLTFDRVFSGTQTYTVSFDIRPRFVRSPSGLYTAVCGSLVFSLPIDVEYETKEYVYNDVERKFPYCDYYLHRRSDWAFAYEGGTLTAERQAPDAEVPFSSKHPAVVLKTRVCPINWGYADGYDSVAAPHPESTAPTGNFREIALVPYACAKLRMTELPFAKKH